MSTMITNKISNELNIVYISGALHQAKNITDLTKFYETTALICRNHNLIPFVPHLFSHPTKHKDEPSEVIFKRDLFFLLNSKLIIAYTGEKSLGVGAELGFAHANNIPILICYEEHKRISRFIEGMTDITQKRFKDIDDWTYYLCQFFSANKYMYTNNNKSTMLDTLGTFDVNQLRETTEFLLEEIRESFWAHLYLHKSGDNKTREIAVTKRIFGDFMLTEVTDYKRTSKISLPSSNEAIACVKYLLDKRSKVGYEIVNYKPISLLNDCKIEKFLSKKAFHQTR